MTKRLWATLLGAALVASNASVSLAATWQKVGDSASFTENTAAMRDSNRLRLSSMAVDGDGNVYVSVHNNERGAVIIWKPDNTKIEIDLESKGLKGVVTRLVVGGDGLVYGAQNWGEINWMFARDWPNRILQIHPDGNVYSIYCPDKDNNGICDMGDQDRIMDIAVNTDDGNVYWVMDGRNSAHWRWNFFWRFNVAEQVVEPAPINGANNGWLSDLRMRSLHYVGDDNFLVHRSTGSGLEVSVMRWNTNRRLAENHLFNPSWRNWPTAGAYDHGTRKMWSGARGISISNVTMKANGRTSGNSFFGAWPAQDPVPGLESWDAWHTNGNDAFATGITNGPAIYWVNTIAVNPADGSAWMAYGHNPGYTGNDIGRVMVRGKDVWDYYDMGMPEPDAWVMALEFSGSQAYAAVVNMVTGKWSLYTTYDVTPEVPTLSAGAIKQGAAIGLQMKTGDTVATMAYPNSYGFLYVEEADRSSGIRIEPMDESLFVNVGDTISFQGVLAVRNKAEAVLAGATVQGQQPGNPLNPLYMNNKELGGIKAGYQPAVLPGIGVNNIGLYVTVMGKLTEYSADATGLFFRLDDGSTIANLGAATVKGVKVRGIPMSGDVGNSWLKASGILAVEVERVNNQDVLVPVILLPDGAFGEQVAP